jgi:polyhydroxybutyrate depolymerase
MNLAIQRSILRLTAVLVSAWAFLTGCDEAVAPDPASTESASAPVANTRFAPCTSAPLQPGLHRGLTVHPGRLPRAFDLNVPSGTTPGRRLPVVFVLHPLTQNREWGKLAADMVVKSQTEGFLAVFPEGTLGSWNGGTCCGTASHAAVDDVTFVREIHARLRDLTCMDESRVYATGLSNGGFMSHRLACEAADIITAVAPVAGVLGIAQTDCRPTRPVPLLQIHGTADPLVPYDGGLLGDSVPDTMAAWARRNGCTAPPLEVFRQGEASCTTYRSCAAGAEVSLCRVEGGGHCWFGEPICFVGHDPRILRATDVVWGFLRRFSM